MPRRKRKSIWFGKEYKDMKKLCAHVNREKKLEHPMVWNTSAFLRELIIRYGAKLADDLVKEK